jgi:hypothetical protein
MFRVSTWVSDALSILPDGQELGSCVPSNPQFTKISKKISSNQQNKIQSTCSGMYSTPLSIPDSADQISTLKNTARVYKNKVSTEVVRLERRPGGAKFEDLQDLVSGERGKKVFEDGDPDAGVWS